MSTTKPDPIELLREIYKHVDNGEKEKVALVVEAFKSLEAENQTLRTRLEAAPLPEAPASATVKVVDPVGQLEWLVTVRSHAPAMMIEEMTQTVERLRKNGYIAFDTYVDQRRAERGQDTFPKPTPPNAPPLAKKTDGNNTPSQTFKAKTLEATASGGKAYWKVKGGKFEKFGVTIWPEVLQEAGFFVDNLDPMEVYSLEGYTATYSTKDDGKPDKITKLEKVT